MSCPAAVFSPDYPDAPNVVARKLDPKGYAFLTLEVGGRRHRIAEHRYLAQMALGRPLRKGEVVHHRNGDRTDNRPENLLVCMGDEHIALHASERFQSKRPLPNAPTVVTRRARLRTGRGWTQRELADKAGVSAADVHHAENVTGAAREATIRALASALGVSAAEYLGPDLVEVTR